jgi:hypothetical protein
MSPEQFVYWLQGFMEVADPKELNERQTQQIKNHLNLVFDKKTPDVSLPLSQTITHTGNPFIINPYDITCGNLPDPMTTPICSVNTTTLDPDIQKTMNSFSKEVKTKSKKEMVKSPNIKC